MTAKLTHNQAMLIERMKHPKYGSRLLCVYAEPGTDRYGFYIESPYSDEDARTVNALIDRRILIPDGGAGWVLAPAYR